MKRTLSLLLALLTLTFGLSALAEVEYGSFQVEVAPGSQRVIDAPLAGSLNAVCVDGDDVYVLEDGQLYSADAELNRIELLHTFERELCGLSVSDGVCYYGYVDGDRTRFARLTADGEAEELFDVQTERTMFRMLVASQTVFALWEYSAYELQAVKQTEDICKLAAYDLSGREQPLPVEDASDIALYPGRGVLLLQLDGTVSTCVLRPETGNWQELDSEVVGLNIAASSDGSGLFVQDFSGIYRRSDDGSSSVDLSPDLWLDSALACTATHLISYRLHGDMEMRSWQLSEIAQTSGNDVLTLVNAEFMMKYDATMQSALEQFQQLHPDVKVVNQEMDAMQLTTAILANDGSVDVIMPNGMSIDSLLQAGALYDLNQDAELKARLESWVGSQVLHKNGIRFGVPESISTSVLEANESLSQYAPELDWQNCSWLEVLEAAEQMETDLTGDGVQDIWFLCENPYFPLWFEQYLASFDGPRDISFDTDAFRQLAEQYHRCVQAGVILSPLDPDSDSDLALYRQSWIFGCGVNAFLPLPTIDGKRTAISEPYSLSIVRSSKHIDWALDLLKCYTSDEAQRADWDPVFVTPNFRLSPGWEENPYFAISTEAERENLRLQQEYVNQSVYLLIDSNFYDHSADLFEQFYDGQIALDELVDGLQQKLQMVQMG